MFEYNGNAIYDYIEENQMDYFYLVEHNWLLVYGDSHSIPKLLVLAWKRDHIEEYLSREESKIANRAYSISRYLRLPFLFVQFMVNSSIVDVWDSYDRKWKKMSYDELRNLYAKYGLVESGKINKEVNQYVSSTYQDWQRSNLGNITVSDLDLLKIKNNKVESIIELKRSKVKIEKWKPFRDDFPNFALIINTIVTSGKNIQFRLYYNELEDGMAGNRKENIAKIKAFTFEIPDRIITSQEVCYWQDGIYEIDKLLD